jgi:hypothetical protein
MSPLSIQVPFPVFQDRDGQPLENGYVWIGIDNLNPQTNPVVAYYDAALTITAVQPLRTLNGYISNAGTPAQVYVDGADFSILVQDSKGSMVYNFPQGTGIGADACGLTYNPPFTGGVAYPVCQKLSQYISVKDFGATGDGVTNDTAAIQAAANVGGALYFPDGTYEITHVDLSSNTQLIGESWNTIIHQIAGTNPRPGAYDGMFTLNYTNNQTATKDVVFRNIQFQMDLPAGTYTPADEQSHVILGGHTENVTVDNCYFYGWRGDAVFVGSQMSGVGVPTNYAAQNTTIRNCRFDGINNTCRQGVTGGSVDGLYISDNYFVNTTNATMPGAIDVEPELQFAYARNISVTNNIFVGIGPVGARRRAVIFDLGNLNLASTDRRGNITVADNYMNTSNGVRVVGAKITNNVNFISNWIFLTDETMILTNVDGLVIADNYFEDCATILVGFSTSGAEVKNASIYGNTFDTCGGVAAALQVNTLTNGSICDNQFIDCGGSGDFTAIRFAGGGTQTGVTVHDNVFTTPNAITVNALLSSGTQDAESIYHNNIFKDNINPGNWQNGFYLNGAGMISSTTVSFAANGGTILYYVPPNKKLILTKAVVIAGADAGATTTISIGQSTSTTDFIPANTLSNLDAADDAVILQPIPNTTPLKSRAYPAGIIISCTIATASGGATNTVQLYGTFI